MVTGNAIQTAMLKNYDDLLKGYTSSGWVVPNVGGTASLWAVRSYRGRWSRNEWL